VIGPAPGAEDVAGLVERALAEDLGSGDVTSNALIPAGTRAVARFVAKDGIVAAGLTVAAEVFRQVDPGIEWSAEVSDGSRVPSGGGLAAVSGCARSILRGERTALNFLQRMSGIATTTRRYTEAVDGTRAAIVDTRKTVPGLRVLDKYAVRCGGGTNHRFGLFDAILIKNNHLEFCASAKAAVEAARAANPGVGIEVEVRDMVQLESALGAAPDIILLDNFTFQATRAAVARVQGRIPLESSGGITIENVRRYAEAGVDRISIGALTHSVRAADIHLQIERA
jgi:nicotinate-nucleotide pyrophosphorylase (carboxylating)